jgi:peroxiredoxin
MSHEVDGKKLVVGVIVLTILVAVGQLAWNARARLAARMDSSSSAHASAADVRVSAPDFELSDLNGASVRLSQYKGERPVLIYFWATWCSFCVEMRPTIAKMRESIAEQDMAILGINVGAGDSLERVKKFQKGHPVTWPILYDGDGRVTQSYQVSGIPLFVLVNKDGLVVYRNNLPPEDPAELF